MLIPKSSYVAKDTFIARAKLCKRSTHVKECKFVHKGSMRCQSQSSPTVANYLESVSCLWSLEGRYEVRRHSFQILVGCQVRSECITSVHSKNFPWISSFLSLDNCSSVSTSETRFSILFREDAWLLLQTDLDCNWLEAGGFAYPKIKLCRQRYLPCKSETLQAFNTCRRVQVCPQREHALSISEFPHRRKLSGVGVVFVIAWREKRSSPSLIPNISRRQVRSECITSVHSKNFPWISSFLSLDNCSSVSTSETRFSILFREDAWLLLQTYIKSNQIS